MSQNSSSAADSHAFKGKDATESAMSKGKEAAESLASKGREVAESLTAKGKDAIERLGSTGKAVVETLSSKGKGVVEAISSASHREGGLARPIEEMTAKLPSDTFLWLAWGSVALSMGLWFGGRKQTAAFVGLWAPTLLLHGVYNKMVKQHGHDKYDGHAPVQK